MASFKEGPMERNFSPYADNGGSVVAIAGDDYAIIASDTRLSSGYSIYTREQPKLFNISKNTVFASSGCWCDILAFSKILEAKLKMYLHEHNKSMSTPATAQLVSTLLYYKRFFPYYISNIVAGLDNEGKGCVYHYDPVGHCEKVRYTGSGSSCAMIQPFLDSQVGKKNQTNPSEESLSAEKAVAIIKDIFISAAERDIYTGDGVVISIITKDGIKEEKFPLRKD